MNPFKEISEKFIKSLEEMIPSLEGRIVISGQAWQEFTDGKPFVILSLLDSEAGNFTEGDPRANEDSTWSRNFKITLHVYGRDIGEPLYIAEQLAFCCDKTPMINKFLNNGVGVFSDRKIRNLSGIEGAMPEQRHDIDFTLKFIGRSEGTLDYFERIGAKKLIEEA